MLNRIILIGRLVADPELRYTNSGISVANMRIAVDRPFKNQQGEREADFIDIVCWRGLADTVSTHLNKGRLIAVDGRLQIRQYEWEGQRRQAAEVYADTVQFLDSRRDSGGSPPPPPPPPTRGYESSQPAQTHQPSHSPQSPQTSQSPQRESDFFPEPSEPSDFSGSTEPGADDVPF